MVSVNLCFHGSGTNQLVIETRSVLSDQRLPEYSRVEPRTVKAMRMSFPNSSAMAAVILLVSFSFLIFLLFCLKLRLFYSLFSPWGIA